MFSIANLVHLGEGCRSTNRNIVNESSSEICCNESSNKQMTEAATGSVL